MNYYKPEPKSEKERLHKYPNDRLVTAIKSFQRDNGLTVNGKVIKGGETEQAINEKFESHGASFEYPVNTDKSQIAIFDGYNLTIQDNGTQTHSWKAMSGKKDYQGKENQDIKDKGPLPEGIYVARQSGLQHIDDYNLLSRLGNWKGDIGSWGKHRVWLEPAKNTNTMDRDGFSVHGGSEYGSAGCIDLEKNIDDFTKWFENNGKDVIVHVKY